MSETFSEWLEVKDSAGTVSLGRIKELDPTSTTTAVIANYFGLRILDAQGRKQAVLRRTIPLFGPPPTAPDVNFILGGGELPGKVSIVSADEKETIQLSGAQSAVFVKVNKKSVVQLSLIPTTEPLFPGGPPHPELGGAIFLSDATGSSRIVLNAATADAHIGGKGRHGDLFLYRDNDSAAVHLGGLNNAITLYAVSGEGGSREAVQLEGNGRAVVIKNDKGKDAVVLDGANSTVTLSTSGKSRIHMSAPQANIYVGGNGMDGQIFLYPEGVEGAAVTDGSKASIQIDGKNGDVVLTNADCAEEFDVAEAAEVEPGTVMVLDQEGKLRQSKEAYDKKVAGVISGAGDCKPGIVLDKKHSQHNRMPLAMLGKVCCKADAQYGPIEVGDLLTTSPTPGHAMRANEPGKAFGSVIGKALRPLKFGSGLIPILIALQ